MFRPYRLVVIPRKSFSESTGYGASICSFGIPETMMFQTVQADLSPVLLTEDINESLQWISETLTTERVVSSLFKSVGLTGPTGSIMVLFGLYGIIIPQQLPPTSLI
jgi:hypothetical protein